MTFYSTISCPQSVCTLVVPLFLLINPPRSYLIRHSMFSCLMVSFSKSPESTAPVDDVFNIIGKMQMCINVVNLGIITYDITYHVLIKALRTVFYAIFYTMFQIYLTLNVKIEINLSLLTILSYYC